MTPMIPSRLPKQSGFTIIELLIAAAIGLFMTAIIAGLFINMRGSFRYQEDFSRLQENGRFAMEAIARDIRMAGYNGCGSISDFANVVNNGGTNPFLNFSSPLIGYDGSNLSTFPDALTDAGAIDGSDAIVLLGVDTSSELVVQSHNPNSAQINTNTHTIPAGTMMLITDCSHTALFQMTGPSSASKTNVVHNTGTGSPGNCTKFLGASCPNEKSYQYKPGASLLQIYSNAYFVAPSSTGTTNSLYSMSMAGQTTGTPAARELIEGVQGLQITYGIDTNGDRSADSLGNTATAVADWTKVVSVQVSILVKSTKDNLTSTEQTESFNGTEVKDHRLQKIFTQSVTVRNRTP